MDWGLRLGIGIGDWYWGLDLGIRIGHRDRVCHSQIEMVVMMIKIMVWDRELRFGD